MDILSNIPSKDALLQDFLACSGYSTDSDEAIDVA